jgi:outer membrane lipoprotein-sorting protein
VPIKCQQVESRLRAYVDGEMSPADERAVLAHLEHCAACRAAQERIVATLALIQDVEIEEPPDHFSANLQLRLAHLRSERRAAFRSRRPLIGLLGRPGLRYGLTFSSIVVAVIALFLLSPPGISAAELVGKIQASWARLRNYQCTFVSEGVVHGEAKRFEQRQWFQKPNLFRLETREHYSQVTYVEQDRVSIFLPGADWLGRPVAIVRERREREPGLPFPYGADWPETEDVTIDALVRQLQARQAAEVMGTETLLGKPCYVLKFHTRRPGRRRLTFYLMWIDRESFLPMKVKRYEDAENHLLTEAVDLQLNTVFPSDTFRFEPPATAFVAHGDIGPNVFALRPQRTVEFDEFPLRTGRYLLASRGRHVPFRPIAPGHLPRDYALLRVRYSTGRWLDAYWVNNTSGSIMKLVEQAATEPDPVETRAGNTITMTTPGGERSGRIVSSEVPYLHHQLSWRQDGVSLLLSTAEMPARETVRIAGSMETVEPIRAPAALEEAAASVPATTKGE